MSPKTKCRNGASRDAAPDNGVAHSLIRYSGHACCQRCDTMQSQTFRLARRAAIVLLPRRHNRKICSHGLTGSAASGKRCAWPERAVTSAAGSKHFGDAHSYWRHHLPWLRSRLFCRLPRTRFCGCMVLHACGSLSVRWKLQPVLSCVPLFIAFHPSAAKECGL
jgi:hypothetical protein